MSAEIRQLLTALALPPVLLLLLALGFGLLAWRGRRWAGLGAALCALGVLLLATPAVSGLLIWSLERELLAPSAIAAPGAIVILGAEVAHGMDGPRPGPLTLERLRAGAALHRATGLPILVTGGVLAAGDPPIAMLMAHSLVTDFSVPAQWVEPRAADTRENARFSAEMLAEAGIPAAHLVSHAWHLPRALQAFQRAGFAVLPAPVMRSRPPGYGASQWLPRADHLAESGFALREWAGRLVYAIRD
jgi:uncharacterized SAM-binding protein YcdF (DUF218 family)